MARLSSLFLLASVPQAYANVAKASLRAANTTLSRKLSYEPIANYIPTSLVTDINAIDLDQKFLEQELRKETSSGDFNAKAIYQLGGNSKTIARVNLLTPLGQQIPEGTEYLGLTESNEEINLTLFRTGEMGTSQLQFKYGISSVQEYYNQCRVGALQPQDRKVTGCLKGSGAVQRKENGALVSEIRYSYSITEGNYNDRTLQGFSQRLEQTELDCPNCPHKDAKMFTDYYGQSDYGDKWIMAAFDGQSTEFSNGNANFQQWGYSGRGECIKKGTVYFNVFMFVLREFEGSLDNCSNNKVEEGKNRWDRGVAYYTGSAEKGTGSDSGYLLHELADKRCRDFKTCGLNGDLDSSTSKVNHDFLRLSRQGQGQIGEGKCEDARKTKESIADIMYIPLIQGALRYAHIMENSDVEKDKGEGAVFAAAVLPRIHAANPMAATTIYSNMRVGASSTNFGAVKEAFESTYKDMNIRCDQIGGIVTSDGYAGGASPCNDKGNDNGNDDGNDDSNGNDDDSNQGFVLGAVLGSIAGSLFLGGIGSMMFIRGRNINETPVFESNTSEQTFG